MKNSIEICLEIKRETPAALFVTDGVTEPVWIPKSQIKMLEDGGPGDTVDIEISEWLAEDKGFI